MRTKAIPAVISLLLLLNIGLLTWSFRLLKDKRELEESAAREAEGRESEYFVESLFYFKLATMLRTDQTPDVLTKFDTKYLPGIIRCLSRELKSHENADSLLWSLKQYYTRYSIPCDEDIKLIFSKVPNERPSSTIMFD